MENMTETSIAHHWDSVLEREFKRESDRAAVILTGSLFDDALYRLLKCSLVPCSSRSDDIFDSANAPLSTFSARISMSHRLGLISSKFCRDLNLIRKIRNEFAHNIHGCDFGNSSIRSRVFELTKSLGIVDRAPDIRGLYDSGPRGDFLMTCSLMLWTINSLVDNSNSIDECPLENAYILSPENE